jgi:hypothetical protein
VLVTEKEVWRTIEDMDCVLHPATFDMLIVSMVLCESLLSNCCPDGLIFAQGSENGVVTNDWETIIDDLSERNTKCVHIKGVDTVLINFVIYEDLIDSSWNFSEGRNGCHEPAVADATLVYILRSDSITPESVVLEIVLNSLPLHVAKLSVEASLTNIWPIESISDGELLIYKVFSKITVS